MIKILHLLSFLLISTLIHAQDQEGSVAVKGELSLTIKVPNAPSDKGKMAFALYQKSNFMAEPTASKMAKIKEKVSTVTFENLNPGIYAVIVFHDTNDNGTMDFDENRMPVEDYAISNNPRNMGPPNFESAKFSLSENQAIEIKM